MTPGERRDDGAVAVLVSIVAIVLFVMAAIAADIGYSYAEARQLSVAADADALAAAAAVGEAIPPGTACTQGLLDTLTDGNGNVGAVAIAKATADKLNTANNRTGASEPVESVTVACVKSSDADTGTNAVEVKVTTRRSVETVFAGLIGIDSISPNSWAVARYARVRTAGGLRPWAVCDDTVTAAQAAPTTTFWTGIDKIAGPCDTSASGNWGAVDFDGGNNSAGDLADWTRDGYPGPVTIPSDIPADPGVSNSSELRAAFQSIVNQVVLFPSVEGFNDETGKNPSGGSNASFPTIGIVTAKVCGIKYGNKPEFTYKGDCWEEPVAPTFTDVPDVDDPVEASVAKEMPKSSNELTISGWTFPTEPTDPSVSISAEVVIPGADAGGKDLTTTVSEFTGPTTATLADPVKVVVPLDTKITITVTTTSILATGGLPLPQFGPFDSKGNALDHIQFRWVNYSTSSYPGSSQGNCEFTDPQCAGATYLWR